MPSHSHRSRSFGFLCISPLLIAIVAGLGPMGVPGAVQYACALVLIATILFAAWTLGARALRTDAPERRRLAAAGGLLVTVLAAITIFAVMGRPSWRPWRRTRLATSCCSSAPSRRFAR